MFILLFSCDFEVNNAGPVLSNYGHVTSHSIENFTRNNFYALTFSLQRRIFREKSKKPQFGGRSSPQSDFAPEVGRRAEGIEEVVGEGFQDI